MPPIRHLPNAPIREALVDVRVKANERVSVEIFEGIRGRLSTRFPKVQQQKAARIEFQLPGTEEGSGAAAIRGVGSRGVFFQSADDRLVAQFRVDGFTLNRLRPYESWDKLIADAIELWQLYISVAQPVAVTRLALRYINQIALPADLREPALWMNVPPQVPAQLPQEIGAFLYRVTIQDARRELSAHIAQVLEASPGPTLLLDIDAFKQTDLPPTDPSVEEVLGALHDFKNEIFFSMLTEEAIRSFE